jgi:hypothetical protein
MWKIDDETKKDLESLDSALKRNFPEKRKEEIRTLHLDAFRWQGRRIPLGLLFVNPDYAIHKYPGLEDPLPFFKMKIKNITGSVSFGSDLWPTVSLDYFGDSVIPSMLGAAIKFPEKDTPMEDAATVGPWIIPVIKDIKEVWDLKMPDMNAGLMPLALDSAAFFREHLPEGLTLSTIWKVEPFTLAALLRGSDIYLDMYDSPDEIRHLLDFCTELFIQVEMEFRKVSGHGIHENISHWGIWSPGIRLNGDTIINLSPDMLDEFIKKPWERLAEVFGGPVYTHYCSTRVSKGFHLFPVIEKWKDVALGLSTQEGVFYYEDHYEELEGKFVIESGYTGANAIDLFTPLDNFAAWAERINKKQYRTGLLLCYNAAKSLEEGQKIMEAYNRLFLT